LVLNFQKEILAPFSGKSQKTGQEDEAVRPYRYERLKYSKYVVENQRFGDSFRLLYQGVGEFNDACGCILSHHHADITWDVSKMRGTALVITRLIVQKGL
jgi:hypothetical protein